MWLTKIFSLKLSHKYFNIKKKLRMVSYKIFSNYFFKCANGYQCDFLLKYTEWLFSYHLHCLQPFSTTGSWNLWFSSYWTTFQLLGKLTNMQISGGGKSYFIPLFCEDINLHLLIFELFIRRVSLTNTIRTRLCRKGVIANQTVCELFVYQMHVHVVETASKRCSVCEWFEFHSSKPKFVVFLREHEGNFAHCVDRLLHVCKPHACYPQFLHFFQYGLINVCRVRTQTMARLRFKENWFTVHLVRIVFKPHNVIKVSVARW